MVWANSFEPGVPVRHRAALAVDAPVSPYAGLTLVEVDSPFKHHFPFAKKLDRPTSGSYLFKSEDVSDRDFDKLAGLRNESIGFIFQSFNLIPVLNVVENIEFPCLMRKERESSTSLRQHVGELAEEVGLTPYLKHRPDELSGGQRQRVAIARALITNPELVLADEPTANLDSKTSQQIITLMQRLNQEKGVTFVFSTHDPRVTQNAKRVVYIADGKIVEHNPMMS
jgi:putative ABC transport system ATP-binding protein